MIPRIGQIVTVFINRRKLDFIVVEVGSDRGYLEVKVQPKIMKIRKLVKKQGIWKIPNVKTAHNIEFENIDKSVQPYLYPKAVLYSIQFNYPKCIVLHAKSSLKESYIRFGKKRKFMKWLARAKKHLEEPRTELKSEKIIIRSQLDFLTIRTIDQNVASFIIKFFDRY